MIFPYNFLYTQVVAYTTYLELGEPVGFSEITPPQSLLPSNVKMLNLNLMNLFIIVFFILLVSPFPPLPLDISPFVHNLPKISYKIVEAQDWNVTETLSKIYFICMVLIWCKSPCNLYYLCLICRAGKGLK